MTNPARETLEARWAELMAVAKERRWTDAERDETRVLWRRLEPAVQFSPSTAVMASRFGHLARTKARA